MQRRTLDIMFSIGGFLLAALLVTLGFVLNSNSAFAEKYVKDQLTAEKIEFKAVDKLTPEERAYTDAHSGCLVMYAGQALTTGKQAECYANELIGGHLADPKKIPFAEGKNYRELGLVQADLRTQIAAAQANRDPALSDLQTQLEGVTTARETVFQGTMLRNALLTSYGFSVLGDKAAQGATIAFVVAGVLALLSAAGLMHAFVTPKTKAFAPVERPRGNGQGVRTRSTAAGRGKR